MSTDKNQAVLSFSDLDLPTPVLKAVEDAAYEAPTPIQQEIIPHLLAGADVVGQAQTGTGKTAAFALPLLAKLLPGKDTQILVLTPTRELAIQVAESFKDYGKHIKGLNILPVFGGQDYSIQLKQLRHGAQVIVGTPGRVMDHIRKKNIKTETIHSLVLDEADEMLRMGFLDDVEWTLKQLPNRKQTALFSATMPTNIKKIARNYLNTPQEIAIRSKEMTAKTVKQRYLIIQGGFMQKVTALTKILETEDFDSILIFVRTKVQTTELAEKMSASGYSCGALNGDIQQSQRQRMVEQLKSKKIDILVATDVAARGLDVERISHVINFDIPFDTEAYVHRIGRTGRAGRTGEAILFVNPREKSMLRSIERATRQKISLMALPTTAEINAKRVIKFKESISTTLQKDISFYEKLLIEYLQDNEVDPLRLAAALAQLTQGNKPLLLKEQPEQPRNEKKTTKGSTRNNNKKFSKVSNRERKVVSLPPDDGMERFRIEVGSSHGVKPSNIVGAIANEADISSSHIGRINIFDNYSTVDLPYGMPNDIFRLLQRIRVCNRKMKLRRFSDSHDGATTGTKKAKSVKRKMRKTKKPRPAL